jgi:hypothetical protein
MWVESCGFEVGVFVAGRYPLVDHARAAALLFNKHSLSGKTSGMLAWAFVDHLVLR